MAEQLLLELEAAPPPLPANLRPMVPTSGPEPFDSPDYLFEPSWGGVRALIFVERDAESKASVRIVTEDGQLAAEALPELAGIDGQVPGHAVILDAELVVADEAG